MRYHSIGSTDIKASVIGLGTFPLEGWMWGGPMETGDAVRLIHEAIDAGINLIDTAPMYGFGLAEEIVGRAIKGRRDKVVIATKCGIRNRKRLAENVAAGDAVLTDDEREEIERLTA